MKLSNAVVTKLFLISLSIFFINNVSAQVKWDRYKNNPILSPGEAGSWENPVSAIISVLYHNGMYKAWIAGTDEKDTGRIGYATSEDGIVWTRYEKNPVLVPGGAGEWDEVNADHACVIFVDSVFKMWYMGEDESSARIGYATSKDGIDWDKYVDNPVLKLGPPGSWDENEVMHPSVIYDGELYHMWYNGYGQESQRTGYATSKDGIDWTKHPGNPVITTGGDGAWDEFMLALMSVVKINEKFEMWYTASAEASEDGKGFRIGYATSTDGIKWDKYKENPVLDIGDGGEWDSQGVVTSAVLFDTTDKMYKMWYGGFDGSTIQTGYATSGEFSALVQDKTFKIPQEFELRQNYPNPFNPSTTIEYSLNRGEKVRLTIYDMTGREIKTLINGIQTAGIKSVSWDGHNKYNQPVASGVYVYRLQTGGMIQSKKVDAPALIS